MTVAQKPISCRELVELVTDLLEGELSEATLRQVEAHLDACDGCEAYVEQMRVTITALRALDGADAAEIVRDRAIAAFRELKA
jgi:anti-sigma factor RsiW